MKRPKDKTIITLSHTRLPSKQMYDKLTAVRNGALHRSIFINFISKSLGLFQINLHIIHVFQTIGILDYLVFSQGPLQMKYGWIVSFRINDMYGIHLYCLFQTFSGMSRFLITCLLGNNYFLVLEINTKVVTKKQ